MTNSLSPSFSHPSSHSLSLCLSPAPLSLSLLHTLDILISLKGSGNFVLDPLEIILDLAHAAMIIINL